MFAGLQAESRLAPRGTRAGMTNRGAAFAAAVRVVAGVHDRTAAARAHAHVTLAAGLAQVDILMVKVGNDADRRNAVQRDIAHLARGQTHKRVAVFLRHQLSHNAGRANKLAALARVKLNVVDHGTNRDVLERESVARLDIGVGAGHDLVADLEAVRREDVALGAVLILDEGDEGGTVRVILKGQDGGGDIKLVALEVDDTVLDAVAAAMVADGDLAGVVAAGMLLFRLQQAALGLDVGKHAVIGDSHAAAARRSRLVLFDRHCLLLLVSYEFLSGSYPHKRIPRRGSFFFRVRFSDAHALGHAGEELDLLGVGGQRDDGFLALGSIAGVHALAAVMAADVHGVDLGNLDAEQFLNRLGDIDLGGVGGNLEGVLLLGDASHRVLGDDGGENDILCEFHQPSTSSSFLAASRLMIIFSALTTS